MEQRLAAAADGRRRVVIGPVRPELDAGRYPIKRTVGERVTVSATCFADGHDQLAGVLRYRPERESAWRELPLESLGNDRWRASFVVDRIGRWSYGVVAWVDAFASWRSALTKRVSAGTVSSADLRLGAVLVAAAADRAAAALLGTAGAGALEEDASRLRRFAERLELGTVSDVRVALDAELAELVARHPDRRHATVYDHELQVVVDRPRASQGAWYELFPRSAAEEPGRHGTLRDVIARLPYVAELGFDVLYLTPIHPIGTSHRKGRNNRLEALPGDPGSPWAIGSPDGGHTAIHPELGTLEDFRALVQAAAGHDLELALDLAFQCSPDHPWVRQHPEWFRHRPDGSIQYAENPPKRYEDIVPFDFECAQWQALWQALHEVTTFWIAQGVRIFRVDNPHTKPFRFWEWLIGEVKRESPEVIFLAEAFTRPSVMKHLAKLGFSQSYTYFTWRNSRAELEDYFIELNRSEQRDYLRPNLFVNTPDILHEYLQIGGRPAFFSRLVLAATLGGNYGVYGPAFELVEARPHVPGSEEYLDSEKYQLRHWALDAPDSLRPVVARLNQIRRGHPALLQPHELVFHDCDNDLLLCYSRRTPDRRDVVLVVVNLDPHHRQSGWVRLDLAELGLEPEAPFRLHDLLSDQFFLWRGDRNFIELDPASSPAHVFHVQRRLRTEHDFEYFL